MNVVAGDETSSARVRGSQHHIAIDKINPELASVLLECLVDHAGRSNDSLRLRAEMFRLKGRLTEQLLKAVSILE
jgi:hypothetical protein